MKRLKFGSIGLVTSLSLALNCGFIGKVLATVYCDGAGCNDKDPVQYNCVSDARVVSELTQTVYRWQDAWQPRQIIVQKVYSERCHATWTHAYIPDDTYLFIREQELVNGIEQTSELFKADGTGYFWATGKMSNGNVVNQACAALPSIVIPRLGYLYDRYCTEFN